MEEAHLKELITLESSYWWHVSKQRLATALLNRYACPSSRIVEGGIGAGGNLLYWQSQGYEVHGLDIMPASVTNAQQRGLVNIHQHDLHEPWPIEKHSAQAVVLLDVLEHLREPVVALNHAANTLRDDGKIIFTVPAHPWLFSEWDERLGHFRRYTEELLRTQVQHAGLRLIEMRPWNAVSLPIAGLIRTYRRIFPNRSGAEFPRLGVRMNTLLIRVQEWERQFAERASIPFGLSFVGVISK